MIERKWYVDEDRQGGSFGMSYGSMTADEWLDVAAGWMDDDGAFDEDDGETEEEYRAYWQRVIDRDPQEFIDYFDDAWELTMVEGERPKDHWYSENYSRRTELYVNESVDTSKAVTLSDGQYFVFWGDTSVDALSFNSMQDVCDYVTEICRGICEDQYEEAVKNPDVYDESDRNAYKKGMDVLKPGFTSELSELQSWWELVLVWCWLKCINTTGNIEGELWGSELIH